MDANKYREFLLKNLKPWAKKGSAGKVVYTRCKYCSDSRNSSQGHFYISIPTSDEEPSLFYCQKCHAKGVVTNAKLLEWDSYDTDIAIDIITHNKKVFSLPQNRKYNDGGVIYTLMNKYISDDDLSLYKLGYINKRLGSNLTYEDCLRNKIVLNIKDLLDSNKLDYTRHPNIIDQLDTNFVGFLSYDNAFINLRNLGLKEVYDTINRKYINYNIFDKYDNTNRFYTIPNSIDLCNPSPIKLNIAEGAFDILSIYLNLRKTLDNSIYTSIGGSGYEGIVRFFISNLRLVNLEIHIYADNDIDRYKIVNIANLIYPFHMKLFLHRNIFPNKKDFGVPLEEIHESIEPIL